MTTVIVLVAISCFIVGSFFGLIIGALMNVSKGGE